MWLLTTRNRPKECQEVLSAIAATGCTTAGVVWMDGCHYPGLSLPDNWVSVSTRDHLNIGEIMRRFYADHPDLSWYGWMADDCPPRSWEWDRALIKAAGTHGIAYPSDGWLEGQRDDGRMGPHITSIVCMGGEFVRAMGHWVLPGLTQMYIDDYWESVATPLGLMRFQPDVKAEHRHPVNGKRHLDTTDLHKQAVTAHDREVFKEWYWSADRALVIAELRRALCSPSPV